MSSVLGIDISSHAIDLVRLDETTNAATWTRYELHGDRAFDRLRQVPLVMPLASFYLDVYLMAIETPKTRFMPSAAALFPVYGAVAAALPPALPLWDVRPTDWRKGLGLPGNAKKEECAVRVRQITDWPETRDGISEAYAWPQDAFDAYAVAYFAREINARGVALDEAREKQLTVI